MFLGKIREFASNLPEAMEELNLRSIEVTDELVKLITFIDFTDKDASQDLFEILKFLEFFLFRGRLERPVNNGTSEKSIVFYSIERRLYHLSIEEVPLYHMIEQFLSVESIVRLCLLFLVDGVLDNKCYEKLEKILQNECIRANTCPFVVWCLTAILNKSISYDVDTTILPTWIPQHKNFCDYGRIFDMLSKIALKCSIANTPDYDEFWEMVNDVRNIPYLEKWQYPTDGRPNFIMDQLVDLAKSSKFSMEFVDKLVEFASQLAQMNLAECKNRDLKYQVEEITKVNKIKEKLRKFESRIVHLSKNSDINEPLSLLSTFFKLLKTVPFVKTKKDLIKMLPAFSESLSNCEITPKLEEIIAKNFDEIFSLLDEYDDLNWLYSLVSSYPDVLSSEVHKRYNKALLDSKSHLQGWELLAEYFNHFRWEDRETYLENYTSKAFALFKSLVVDKKSKKNFLSFAEQNKTIIYHCFDRDDVLNNFMYSIFGSYPQFIPFGSKINNITNVMKYFEASEQKNLMFECLKQFQKSSNYERQYQTAIAFFDLLSAQNYSLKDISQISKIHANTINSILLLIVDDPDAKSFYNIFRECQKYLSVEVILKYCSGDLDKFTETQQKMLLSKMLPELEKLDDPKNMFDYLVALEMLLPTFLRTKKNVKGTIKKILKFAAKNKPKCNSVLLLDDGFSIFSRGALLSMLKIDSTILDIDVKHKYCDILCDGDIDSFRWYIFGEYVEKIRVFQSHETEEKMCKLLLELDRDERYVSKFVAKYQQMLNENRYFKSHFMKPTLSKFFLSIPNLLNVETKYQLLKYVASSQQLDWLDEWLETYKTLPVTDRVMRMIDNVCASINKSKDELNHHERMATILEKHIRLIVDVIIPKINSDFVNLQEWLWPFLAEKFPFQTRLVTVKKLLETRIDGSYVFKVDRNNLLESSYNMTSGLTAEQWRTKNLKVKFENEAGVDMGGLLREWLTVTTREILNPNFGLFIPTPGDVNSYMINKSSNINPDHLNLFKFIGRFLAKGILENIHFDCSLTKVLYKHIVGTPVEYSDFESQDPEFYNSLRFMLNNPINEIGLDLTFSTEIEHFGAFEEKELIDNGKNIQVTDENKHEYVKLISEMKMTESIRPQLKEFLAGFYEVISKDQITLFNEKELQMMICGESMIDIEDLKANTVYSGYQESDDVIQWFWKALNSLGNENKARFLMFTTGSPKAPLNGFSALQGSDGVRNFHIYKDLIIGDRLPTARTCFVRLDLPSYNSYEILQRKLLIAIREGTEGFGMS